MNEKKFEELLKPVNSFLHCETPKQWVDAAIKPKNLNVLVIDHLICELKAAQSAMHLVRRYAATPEGGKALSEWLAPFENYTYRMAGDWRSLSRKGSIKSSVSVRNDSLYGQELTDKMVLLIKEELHHFYQVLEIMEEFGIDYENISSSRYAKGLLKHVTNHEPDTLIDKLICGAYIEARSCERFAKIAPLLDQRLGSFYESLLRSESRHYQDYLSLAEEVAGKDISERVEYFGKVEAQLIQSKDEDFKFHSGIPTNYQSSSPLFKNRPFGRPRTKLIFYFRWRFPFRYSAQLPVTSNASGINNHNPCITFPPCRFFRAASDGKKYTTTAV